MKKISLLRLIGAMLSISLMVCCLANCIKPQKAAAQENGGEMRGVWVATVFGLDFPSGTTTSEAQLKQKIDIIMSDCRNAGFNTVFFQVRPACDAFYKSSIFPWSKYLTGTQGKAPENGFDPLQYAIDVAHGYNMELHAWINPYRVTASSGDAGGLAANNPAKLHPDYVVTHTDGKMYLDPGNPEVTKLITDGAVEIVRNYNIDGIHIDDYFYPGNNFNDSATYAKYGNGKSLDNWRRDNVTSMIRSLNDAVHNERGDVMLSVSPSGIWANKKTMAEGSSTDGSESYIKSYADSRRWVKEELIDCIIPQIYWNRGYSIADFNVLVNWWADVAKGTNVKLCIGLAAYKACDTTDKSSPWYGSSGISELRAQIQKCRDMGLSGYSMYRYQSVAGHRGILDMTIDMNKAEIPAVTPTPPPSITLPGEPSNEIFTDMPKFSWARKAIETLYEKKIVNGLGDGSFGGMNLVSRADFTVMLLRATGKTAEVKDNFSDVNQKDYFYKEIGMAKALGIAGGVGNNQFAPRANISRQDMAVMVYRVLKKEGKIKTVSWQNSLFKDGDKIKAYAREAVASLSSAQIINGYNNGTFNPEEFATRAETAVVVYKTYELLK